MSDSELTSEHGTDKPSEKSDVLHRFPIRLKRDRGVWFFQTREPAVLTVLESTIHITKCSRDSFSASGPIYISLKSVTVEAPTRDSTEIRLIQDRRKKSSSRYDHITVTLWCEAISRAKVLAAIFRARAKKWRSVKRKPTFEDSSFRTWSISDIKRTTGAVINRVFRIVPGTVDISAESPDGAGPISVYSIAHIDTVLYSPQEEEATVIFNGGRKYRVWRGSHVWSLLMAVQERARAKLALELIISQHTGASARKRREDIDLAHLAGTDIESLESLCCIEAIRIRRNPDKTDRLVILQVGANFFLERDATHQSVVTVFSPEDILRVSRVNVRRRGDSRACDTENMVFEFSDGRIRNYESVEAGCLLATLYFVRERRGISKFDVCVVDQTDSIAIPEKRLVVDQEIDFRNGDDASAIWEQVPSLAHDIDTYVECLHSFIDQMSHTLRAGNAQSLTNCLIQAQELRLALERFNHLVPPARYRNDAGRTLFGLFPLLEEIHSIMIFAKEVRRKKTSEASAGLEYEDVITSLTVPLLEALSKSLAAQPNLENALRRPRVCKMILDFVLSNELDVSSAALHVLSALCTRSKAVQVSDDTDANSVFELFSKEGASLLEALKRHTKACDFYAAAELILVLHRGLEFYENNMIKVSERFKQQFRSHWYVFYLLGRSKSPILALQATQLLEKACSGGSCIEWDFDDERLDKVSIKTVDKIADPKLLSIYPRVAALVRARGGLLWHLLFALNTRIARECVSDPKAFGYRLSDELRIEQERASTSLIDTLSRSDPRTVVLLRRIFPREVLFRCRVGSPDRIAMRINDATNLNNTMIDAKECIRLLRGDIMEPELVWDQRTRTYLFQAVTRQLEEIDQKHWFGGKQVIGRECSRQQDCAVKPAVWDDFDFAIDYNDVLADELPLGDSLFARPLIKRNVCPTWELRFPQRSLQNAFTIYAASESLDSRTIALSAMKAIVSRHLFDLEDMGAYIRALSACLCDGDRNPWRERSLISEILNISCRDERNMRVMINSDFILNLTRILAEACAVEPPDRSSEVELKYRSGLLVQKSLQTYDYACSAAKSLLNLMFAMSTFSTQDDSAIRCIESSRKQSAKDIRPTRAQRILIEYQPFCLIAQAILSLDDEVYRHALLVVHRLIPFLDPELMHLSGLCLFILARKSNSHIMTASALLARCLGTRVDILDGLLPSQLILLLGKAGPAAFSRIYSSEMRRPDLVWSPESRECLVNALAEELEEFLEERSNAPYTLYADIIKSTQRKVIVVFPDVSSRLVCGGLFADILAEDDYSNEWPVESPVLVTSDAFDLLQNPRTLKETIILLRVQWKMAQRFGAEVLVAALESSSSPGLELYVEMLMGTLRQYIGTQLDVFDMLHMVLTLIELAVVGSLEAHVSLNDQSSLTEASISGDAKQDRNESSDYAKGGETVSTEPSLIEQGSSLASPRASGNNLHVDNGRLARASYETSRKSFANAHGLQTIGFAIEVLLQYHSASIIQYLASHAKRGYIPSLLSGGPSISFEGKRLRTFSSTNIPNSTAPGRIVEAVRMCLNLLNNVVPYSNPRDYEAKSIFSAVDSSLLVLWACSGSSSELEIGNTRFDVADSAFKLLGLICATEYIQIAQYAFEQGLAMCLLQLCLSYRFMDSSTRSEASTSVGGKVEDWGISSLHGREFTNTMKNWLAVNAAQILIKLRNLQDPNMILGLERLLGKLSRYLHSRRRHSSIGLSPKPSRDGKNFSAERFLLALHGDHLFPTLIWNAETRHELGGLCARVAATFLRSPFSRDRTVLSLPSIFSSFQYACHSKEVLVNGVFLRVYNHSSRWRHPDAPSFLMGLLSELDFIVVPDKSGRSPIALDAGLAQKAEVILEAVCNLMSRQQGWENVLMQSGRFNTPFLVLEKGIGTTRLRALDVILLAAQKPMIADSLAERRFALTLHTLAFASVERQLRERCLGLLIICSRSTAFATQLLSMGALVSFVRVFAEGAPMRTSDRVLAVKAIGMLGRDPSIGKTVRKRLSRILPAKIAAIVSEGRIGDKLMVRKAIFDNVGGSSAGKDSIELFDSFSDAPDLLWNEGMRQELLSGVAEATQAMKRSLDENPFARFDDNDDFAIYYSQLESRPMFMGILLDSLLRQLAWPWPFSQTRAEFVCSMIDWMCITEDIPAETECSAMLLISSFAAAYEEVGTSEAVLGRLDKIAVLSVKRLKTVEGIQACIYCISTLFDKVIKKSIDIESPVFWSAVVMLLTNSRSNWKIRLLALHMCLAACSVNKTGCCAALREIQASAVIANRLVHTSLIEQEDEEVEDVDSSSSFNTYGEEFRLLMLLVGLLGAHDEQILNGFKRKLDADLVATALSASLASQEAVEPIWLPLDPQGIFDLVEAAVFTSPTMIYLEEVLEEEEENLTVIKDAEDVTVVADATDATDVADAANDTEAGDAEDAAVTSDTDDTSDTADSDVTAADAQTTDSAEDTDVAVADDEGEDDASEVQAEDGVGQVDECLAESKVANQQAKWKMELSQDEFEEKLDATSLHSTSIVASSLSVRSDSKSEGSEQSLIVHLSSAQWSYDIPALSVAGTEESGSNVFDQVLNAGSPTESLGVDVPPNPSENIGEEVGDQNGDEEEYSSWARSSALAVAALRSSREKR